MSHVRMCDTCGNVFSENAENWSSGQLTVARRNQSNGRMEPVSISQDKCPTCTELMTQPPVYGGQPEVQPTYVKEIPVTGNNTTGHNVNTDE